MPPTLDQGKHCPFQGDTNSPQWGHGKVGVGASLVSVAASGKQKRKAQWPHTTPAHSVLQGSPSQAHLSRRAADPRTISQRGLCERAFDSTHFGSLQSWQEKDHPTLGQGSVTEAFWRSATTSLLPNKPTHWEVPLRSDLNPSSCKLCHL